MTMTLAIWLWIMVAREREGLTTVMTTVTTWSISQRSRPYESLAKTNKKKMKEKEREIYGDNGCIRCPLEGVPLVIIVTSRNEAQAATAVAAPVRHICIT